MSSYDFKGLHDKEFEGLCTDLLGVSMSLRLERFKPGPDQGVDARCFDAGGGACPARAPASRWLLSLRFSLVAKRQLTDACASCGENGVGEGGCSWRDTRLAEPAH
jgi:hypothetical protein